MADGPTVVNSGGSGTVIAVVIGVIAIVVFLIFAGVINIHGGGAGGQDINVKVEAPKVEAPKVEAPKVEAPKVEAPAAPANPAPAPAGG
ncbi:hypothetical protein ACWGTI_29515 [Mesorhizobium sp. ArgA1]